MTKFLTAFVIALIFSKMCWADVYKYTGADGRVYYTDEPPNGKYKRIIRTKVVVRVRDKPLIGGINFVNLSNPANFSKNYMQLSSNARLNKQKYAQLIAQAASTYRVDEKLLHAVIKAESSYNPGAVSSAGAVGLMQLMPATAARYGVTDRTDPVQNVIGGTRYLRDLLNMFNSNLHLAVAGYNAGENAVKRYNNSIPPYPETQNYVKQVLAFYQR